MGYFRRFLSYLMFLVLFSTNVALADVRDHIGVLANAIETGVDGPWEARLQDGWFNLLNYSQPNGIKFLYSTEQPHLTQEWKAEVNVVLRGDGGADLSHAGILLNFYGNDDYLAFTIGSDGSVNLLTGTPDGMDEMGSDTYRAKLDGSDRLGARETATRMYLYLNGETVFTVDNKNGFNSTFGLIAVGMGRFGYDYFKLDLVAGSELSPWPADDDNPVFPTPFDPAGNDLPNTQQEDFVTQVILGTTFGIFFHEFGHALIGETNLPATGPEEDTVDEFSSFVLSTAVGLEGASGADNKYMEEIAEYAVLYWYYSGVTKAQSGLENDWQDEHAPDMKRFRNSFCILYGSNPARYEDIAQKVGFEERTKARCINGFQKRLNAWNTIMSSVVKNPESALDDGYPAGQADNEIRLSFQQPHSRTGKIIYEELHKSGVMQTIMSEFSKMVMWPRELEIEFRECEEINAWYDPQIGKITMCYSLIDFASQVIFDHESF